MPTYYQDSAYIEDGYGKVLKRFVISDTYDGLFANKNDSLEANIFTLEETSKEIKQLVGGITESTISFDVNQAQIKTTNDLNAFNFLISAKNPNNRVFCCKFINPNDLPSANDLQASGIIQSKIEATDYLWHGNNFGVSPNPERIYKFTANPYNVEAINSITLRDLIFGNATEFVTGIDSSWESVYVKDRQGWFQWEEKNNRRVMIPQLVSLNALLRKLSDNLTSTLTAKGFGTLNITFEKSAIDGYFHPSRWVGAKVEHYYDNDNGYNGYYYPRYNYTKFQFGFGKLAESLRGQAGFFTYSTDKKILYLDPDNNPDELNNENPQEALFISYSLVKEWIDDPKNKENESFRLYNKCKHFFDLLEKIASNFGMYIQTELTDSETLNIKFLGRKSFVQDKIYIRTPKSAKLSISNNLIDSDNSYNFSIKCNNLADEGRAYIQKHILETVNHYSVEEYNKNSDSGNMLFGICPTITINQIKYQGMMCKDGSGPFDMAAYDYVLFPFNTYWNSDHKDESEEEYGRAFGLTTALYMCASSETHSMHSDYQDDFTTPFYQYFTPIGGLSVKLNGRDRYFNTLGSYLTKLFQDDGEYLKLEYNMDIPAYYGFASNPEGTDKAWQLCKIGNYIEIDGVEYTIISIKWKEDQPIVSLKLHANTRFSVDLPTSVEIPEDKYNSNDFAIQYNDYSEIDRSKIAYEDISSMQVVSKFMNDYVTIALANDTYYNSIYGIAITSANSNESITIKTKGLITIPDDWADLNIDVPIYLRNGIPNISQLPLEQRNVEENMYSIIGYPTGKRTFKLLESFSENFVFLPYMSSNNV